ncbi:hypothetical protein HELRODRAFT_177586 [Helobdella robusta]|uniref:Uncharacterized protein n=1 Tax=Helobdella robusta TaxID=6412 RepID=T1FBW5_HELRO|nr:hypothetical protein HELRODRAFT_177586 [Helobdella robusta]ESN97924.1 hypothetical protein HELRODRAFT_177586 [Helobdella robusta]
MVSSLGSHKLAHHTCTNETFKILKQTLTSMNNIEKKTKGLTQEGSFQHSKDNGYLITPALDPMPNGTVVFNFDGRDYMQVPNETTIHEKRESKKRKRDENDSPYDTHHTKVTNFLNRSPSKSKSEESSDDAVSQNNRMSEDIKSLSDIEKEHAEYLKIEIEEFEKRQPHITKSFQEVEEVEEFSIYYDGAAIEWAPDITIAMIEEDPDQGMEDFLVTIPPPATMNATEDDQEVPTVTAVTLIMREKNLDFEPGKGVFIVINLGPVNVKEKTTGLIITIHLEIEIDTILEEDMRKVLVTKSTLITIKELLTNKAQRENALKKVIWPKQVPNETTIREKRESKKRKRDENDSPYDTHHTKVTNFLNRSPSKSKSEESSDDAVSQNNRMSEDIKSLSDIEKEHAEYLKIEIEEFKKRQPHITKYVMIFSPQTSKMKPRSALVSVCFIWLIPLLIFVPWVDVYIEKIHTINISRFGGVSILCTTLAAQFISL